MNLRQKFGVAALVMSAFVTGGTWATARNDARAPLPLAELGLAEDHAAEAAPIAAAMPPLMVVGADEQDNQSKDVRLWNSVLRIRGAHTPNYPQQIGDCTSFAYKNVAEYLQYVQIAEDNSGEWHAVFPPFNYGYSRVDIGNGKIRGDGSVGAWVAMSARDGGTLRADAPGCPAYSGPVAKEWGKEGPPQWAKEAAKDHTVKTIAMVKNAQEACDAICNGYPLTIASNFGTTRIVPKDGRRVAVWNSRWPHQMAVVAYDGTAESGERYFYVLNSWGPQAHPAPLQGEPPGGFWIAWKDLDKIVKQGDSWAFSSLEGFPSRDLDFNVFNAAAAVAQEPSTEGSAIMFETEPVIGYGLAGLVAAIGLLLLVLGKNVFRRVGPSLAMLALLTLCIPTASAADALDFAVIGNPAKLSATTSGISSEHDPMDFDVLSAPAPDIMDFGVLTDPSGVLTAALDDCPLQFAVITHPDQIKRKCRCGPDCDCDADDCTCDTTKPPPEKKSAARRIKYPARGSLWTHPGVEGRAALIRHLQQGAHAGKFDTKWLESLSMTELEALHSDDHENKVKPHAVKPTAAPGPKRMVYRKFCSGNQCFWQLVPAE